MSGKRVWIAVLFVMTMLAVFASAQDEKNELTGIFGRTIISDQGIKGATYFEPMIHSGKGTSFEINYARRFLVTQVFAISAEVPVMFNLDEDLNAGEGVVPIDYKQYFITPAVRANLFPTTAVSPWISFGGGFAHFSENKTLIYDAGANPGKSKTSAAIQAGIGLDVKIWRRFSLRGEVRDFWSGEPDFPLAPTGKTRQHNYFVGLGVMWRF
jgi:opacity protein-like surface antigen